MAKHANLFRLLYAIADAASIRHDDNLRPISKKYGILSIIHALIAMPIGAIMMVFPHWMSGNETKLLFFFGLLIFLASIAGMLLMLVHAIVYCFLQLSINRTAITWVALAILILSIAGCALIAYVAIGMF